MSQMENTQQNTGDMLPGQTASVAAKYYYRELDGKIVPLYTKDDFIAAGLSCLGDAELQPDQVRTIQELVYPPRHVKTEDTRSLADIPHQSSVITALSRASIAPSTRVEHRPYQPTTLGSIGVKKYCTHWLRTGECDFNQQGCLFEHIIPDEDTMFGVLGFKTIPRWIREGGQHLPFAPQSHTPPAPAPVVPDRGFVAPSASGPPAMFMGRENIQGRPQAPSGPSVQQRYGGAQRNTVGPNTRPFPVQTFPNNRPGNVGGLRPGNFRPSFQRSNIPAYTPVLPQAGYAGRGDMPPVDRSNAASPASSDLSIASHSSYMHWQPPAMPFRPASMASPYGTPSLTPSGFSNNSSPSTVGLQTPTGPSNTGFQQGGSSMFVPGPSAIFGPRPPVPHIEHRKMFQGNQNAGPNAQSSGTTNTSNTTNIAEKEEGEVTETKEDRMNYD